MFLLFLMLLLDGLVCERRRARCAGARGTAIAVSAAAAAGAVGMCAGHGERGADMCASDDSK